MSKASDLRRARQISRRVGVTRRLFVIAVVWLDDRVVYHFRERSPMVADYQASRIQDYTFTRYLEGNGFLHQEGTPVWINEKATLEDLVKVGVQKVTLVPKAA